VAFLGPNGPHDEDCQLVMKTASLVNSVTYLVNAERELFAGNIGADTLLGLIAAAVTAAVGLVVGVRAISRNIS
jgi:ABC-2 type transport system permease protein